MPFKKNIWQATVNRRVTLFDHEGHQILLLDLTYCTPQEAIQSLQEFKETLSNQSAYSILTTPTIIDLTDGRFTPESIEEMKLVITENRRYLARVAFMAHSTLFWKDKGAIHQYFVRRYPFLKNREDALDFVEHDDQYPLYYSAGSEPRQRTADHGYDLMLLCELFSRLLRHPDDEYWATTQRCFSVLRTRPDQETPAHDRFLRRDQESVDETASDSLHRDVRARSGTLS